jgi:hypothetical protein
MSIYRFFRKFDFFNWIYYRIWNRFHVLKLEYLNPGYHDADEILIHAMFQSLCNFIEKEKPDEIVDWNSDPEHKHAWEEMQEMYNWWKERKNREKHNPLLGPDVKSPDFKFTPTDEKIINPINQKEESTSTMEFVHDSKEAEERWEKACIDFDKWEEKCNKEDEENMIRLIKIRSFMWT